MTQETAALEKLITTLENDITTLGWDQPIKIYEVHGTLADPLFAIAMQHPRLRPYEILNAAFKAGYRVDPRALGLACTHEGWRMKEVADLTNEQEEMLGLDKLRKQAYASGATIRRVDEFLNVQLVQMGMELGIASQPEWLRVEVRTIVLVMRDGLVVVGNRDRGSKFVIGTSTVPGSERFDRNHFLAGLVPEGLHDVLHNRLPEMRHDE